MNDEQSRTSRKRPRSSSEDEYKGYIFPSDHSKIDRVSPSISAQDFFEQYVSKRKPCILTGLPLFHDKPLQITVDNLVKVAGEEVVQVEKRQSTLESFGQNRSVDRQVLMKISELIQQFQGPHCELYYLSTQDTNDTFSAPCRQLLDANHIHSTLPWAGNLVLQACNLWMGATQGSSSGLHHDFHDNFYLQIEGRKQFRLYAASDYKKMETYGSDPYLHTNGLISYREEPTRADGVPLTNEDATDEHDDSSDENEEEVVLGKGFDYQSDDSEGMPDEEGVDDYDELVKGEEDDGEDESNHDVEKRPKSFSRIDLSLPAAQLARDFPEFCSCRQSLVELQAGETLYLPASMFHCVTSFAKESAIHMALNYWYHPPDQLDNFDSPYQDDYWKRQQELKNAKRSSG